MSTTSTVAVTAKLFRGLADPSRLSILEALRDGAKNVSQVVQITGLTQPNTSMHLSCLWRCGLVDRERRGRFTYYRIKSANFAKILEVAEAVVDDVTCRVAECERYRSPPE